MNDPAHTAETRLAEACVVVIGMGGLGCPAARALVAEGVGRLVLLDPDVVEGSNLHRQTLYHDQDVGRPKVDVARERLARLHPDTHVLTARRRFEERDGPLLNAADVVIDGTDSIASKFVVNDAAVGAGVPLVHAGATGLRAQVLTILPGRSACVRCIFEEPPPPGDVPTCMEAGILGPVVALAGALQALEAVRLLRGDPPLFADRVLSIDTWTGSWRTTPVSRRSDCPSCSTSSGDPRSPS